MRSSIEGGVHVCFVPGGPGFSSESEARVLGPLFRERRWGATFWDDPSRGSNPVRSWTAYVDALSSAIADHGSDLTVVAHSFAVHPVTAAVARRRSPCRLLLVAPVLDLLDGHRAIARLASAGLREHDLAAADAIDAAVQDAVTFFDDAMHAALMAASADQHLFERYWRDRQALDAFLETWRSRPESAFDVMTFSAILADLQARAWSLPPLSNVHAVRAVLGGADPIVDVTRTAEALTRWAPGCVTTVLDGAGHWAHLEAPQHVCGLLEQQE